MNVQRLILAVFQLFIGSVCLAVYEMHDDGSLAQKAMGICAVVNFISAPINIVLAIIGG